MTAQWWEQLLYATGGKLELPKCFYYTILWKFDVEGVPYLADKIEEYNIGLISSENGKNERISTKSPYESHKHSEFWKIHWGTTMMNTKVLNTKMTNGPSLHQMGNSM